ncbi:unnamed protein product [Dimorphilus gyrociliatus]|uniref:Uncharacterized protein n=1 Tax=Dimorphilus gyrociliatus TaxID=2664684 RepID=A0A7I8W2T5_9ANNE|nr:unnamed protein product [Dimorphilus gyrociliatus]
MGNSVQAANNKRNSHLDSSQHVYEEIEEGKLDPTVVKRCKCTTCSHTRYGRLPPRRITDKAIDRKRKKIKEKKSTASSLNPSSSAVEKKKNDNITRLENDYGFFDFLEPKGQQRRRLQRVLQRPTAPDNCDVEVEEIYETSRELRAFWKNHDSKELKNYNSSSSTVSSGVDCGSDSTDTSTDSGIRLFSDRLAEECVRVSPIGHEYENVKKPIRKPQPSSSYSSSTSSSSFSSYPQSYRHHSHKLRREAETGRDNGRKVCKSTAKSNSLSDIDSVYSSLSSQTCRKKLQRNELLYDLLSTNFDRQSWLL